MLQESGDELHARQGDMTDLMGLVIAIVESNDVAIDEFQAVVGDRDAEDVAGEIVQDLFSAAGILQWTTQFFFPPWRSGNAPCCISGSSLFLAP